MERKVWEPQLNALCHTILPWLVPSLMKIHVHPQRPQILRAIKEQRGGGRLLASSYPLHPESLPQLLPAVLPERRHQSRRQSTHIHLDGNVGHPTSPAGRTRSCSRHPHTQSFHRVPSLAACPLLELRRRRPQHPPSSEREEALLLHLEWSSIPVDASDPTIIVESVLLSMLSDEIE